MNQEKIGKFIAACRKEQNFTQAQLAEKLGISDRAVSKWETAKSMPDSSLMLELCALLHISVNELLTGERIAMQDYDKFAEENLVAMREQEEAANRKLLQMEVVIGYGASISFFLLIFAACFAVEDSIWRTVMIAAGILIFAVGTWTALGLEQSAGYYKCGKCGHTYKGWQSCHGHTPGAYPLYAVSAMRPEKLAEKDLDQRMTCLLQERLDLIPAFNLKKSGIACWLYLILYIYILENFRVSDRQRTPAIQAMKSGFLDGLFLLTAKWF